MPCYQLCFLLLEPASEHHLNHQTNRINHLKVFELCYFWYLQLQNENWWLPRSGGNSALFVFSFIVLISGARSKISGSWLLATSWCGVFCVISGFVSTYNLIEWIYFHLGDLWLFCFWHFLLDLKTTCIRFWNLATYIFHRFYDV